MTAAASVASVSPQVSAALVDPLDPRRVVGDFDADSLLDSVYLRPLYDCGKGRIEVRYGNGTTATWSREDAAIQGTASCHDYFGASAAVGDFNGDGADDIVIGTPGDDPSGQAHAGAINILYGVNGTGLTGDADQLLHQNNGTIPDYNDAGDYFSDSLASGDFNCDGYDDIAVGVPREDISTDDEAGLVILLYGSECGIAVAAATCNGNTQVAPTYLREGYAGVAGTRGEGDHFGGALAAGNFDDADCDDLAIGVPGDDDTAADGGYVYVTLGTPSGMDTIHDYTLQQGVNGIAGAVAAGDRFGQRLAARDDDADDIHELYVLVPGEEPGERPWTHVLMGSSDALGVAGDSLADHPHESCTAISDPLGDFPLIFEMADLEQWIGAAAADQALFPDGQSGGAWTDHIDAAGFFANAYSDLDGAPGIIGVDARMSSVLTALHASGVNASSDELLVIGYLPYLGDPHWSTDLGGALRHLYGLSAMDAEVEDYINSIDSTTFGRWVAGFRLPDEFADNQWEYRYTRQLRKSLDTHDTRDRQVFGYQQMASRPGMEWVFANAAAWSPDHSTQPVFTDDPWSDVDSYTAAVALDPLSNALRTVAGGNVSEFYGEGPGLWSSVRFMLDASQDPIPVYDDPLQGAYAHLAITHDFLGDGDPDPKYFCGYLQNAAQEDVMPGVLYRSWPYHMGRIVREGVETTVDAQLEAGIGCQEHRAFHLPSLDYYAAGMPEAHARHDMWAGLHHARGVWLHNMAYALEPGGSPTDAWNAYRESLYLLKHEGVRDALAARRVVVVPELSLPEVGGPYNTGTETTIAGDHLIDCYPIFNSLGNVFAMPDYTGVQATLTVSGSTGYLIVTHSLGIDELALDPVQYKIELEGSVASVTQVLGGAGLGCGAQPTNVVCDTFGGIDARVYEITYSSEPTWPPLPEGWILDAFNER